MNINMGGFEVRSLECGCSHKNIWLTDKPAEK